MKTETRIPAKQLIRSKAKAAEVNSSLMGTDRESLLANSLENALATRSKIETAAYYRAEKRGFEPGHELEDWLAAETDIEGTADQPTLGLGSRHNGFRVFTRDL